MISIWRKIICSFLLALAFIVTLSQNTFSGDKRVPLPYFNSEFHRNRVIPYEKCYMGSLIDPQTVANGAAISAAVIGATLPVTKLNQIICSQKNGDYPVAIPISLSPIYYIGPIAYLSGGSLMRVKLTHLDGKTVSDLYGSYKGASAGLSFFLGGNVGYMQNREGVRIRIIGGEMMSFGVILATSHLKIKPFRNDNVDNLPEEALQWAQELSDYRFAKTNSKKNRRSLRKTFTKLFGFKSAKYQELGTNFQSEKAYWIDPDPEEDDDLIDSDSDE